MPSYFEWRYVVEVEMPFKAPDGTIVDADGTIIETGHPQEGIPWFNCEGADPKWRPNFGAPEWRSIDNYEDKDQAIKAAKEDQRKSRVRAFKTTIFTDEPVVKAEDHPKPSSDFPTVSFFCPSHPGETVIAFHTSSPTCKLCRKPMFQGLATDLKDLKDV